MPGDCAVVPYDAELDGELSHAAPPTRPRECGAAVGVDYAHLPTADRGDLYVSWDGLHRLDQLLLENWRLAERRSALFVRHFQKKQIRQLLDVIAIRQPVIPQDVASSSRAFGQFDANSLYRN